MIDASENSRNQSHFVPCVLRTLEILDALRHARPGLRIKDLRSSSRASRSTTYRIVRSLLQGGYIERDRTGRYHLNPLIVQFAHDTQSPAATPEHTQAPSFSDEAPDAFERWGVRFRANGKGTLSARRPKQTPTPVASSATLDTSRPAIQ